MAATEVLGPTHDERSFLLQRVQPAMRQRQRGWQHYGAGLRHPVDDRAFVSPPAQHQLSRT